MLQFCRSFVVAFLGGMARHTPYVQKCCDADSGFSMLFILRVLRPRSVQTLKKHILYQSMDMYIYIHNIYLLSLSI